MYSVLGESFHLFGQQGQLGLGVRMLGAVGQEGEAHVALRLLLARQLTYVRVGLRQFLARVSVRFAVPVGQHPAGGGEERVVESHDVRLTAPVGAQRARPDAEGRVVADARQNLPVAVAPAVDALLDVAHYQAAFLSGQALLQQQPEVLPLHPRRVLKLVNHHRVKGGADFLVHERRIAFTDQSVQQCVGV